MEGTGWMIARVLPGVMRRCMMMPVFWETKTDGMLTGAPPMGFDIMIRGCSRRVRHTVRTMLTVRLYMTGAWPP